MLDGARDDKSTAEREKHLEMLRRLRKRKAGGPLSFSWLDATCHVDAAAAFGLGDVDLPTMIFLSPTKLLWARSVGAFDETTLGAQGSMVAAGKKSTERLASLPTFDAAVDCETVLRGADAVVLDDADDGGADDIMAEILEDERRQREAIEAELLASGAVEEKKEAKPSSKKKSEMSKLERLESAIEECEAMDLLCAARREKQLGAYTKQKALEDKLKEIADKKRKKKKKKKKT